MEMHNPIHPGEYIGSNILDDDSLTEAKLAELLDVSASTINRIINVKSSISCEMALRLEAVLGMTADFWLNMQRTYDLSKLRVELKNELSHLKKLNYPSNS